MVLSEKMKKTLEKYKNVEFIHSFTKEIHLLRKGDTILLWFRDDNNEIIHIPYEISCNCICFII